MKGGKVVAGIVLVFLLGASAGILGTHMIYQRRMEATFLRGHHATTEAIVNRLSRKLDLDSGQQSQLQGIVADSRRELGNAKKAIKPQISAILGKAEERTRAILRPDQLPAFEKIVEERKKPLQGKGD
jgi:hypothetical protein